MLSATQIVGLLVFIILFIYLIVCEICNTVKDINKSNAIAFIVSNRMNIDEEDFEHLTDTLGNSEIEISEEEE